MISVRVPESGVCVHISGEDSVVVCLWCALCSVVYPCQLFCSEWMYCLEEVYNRLQ